MKHFLENQFKSIDSMSLPSIITSGGSFYHINEIDVASRIKFSENLTYYAFKYNFDKITPDYEIMSNIILFKTLYRDVKEGDVVPGTLKKFTETKYGKYYEFRFIGEGHNNGNLYIHEDDVLFFDKLNIDKQKLTDLVKVGNFKQFEVDILFDYTNNKGPLRNVNDSYVKYRKKDKAQSIQRSPSWYEKGGVDYPMDQSKKDLLLEVSAYWEYYRKEMNLKDLKFLMYGDENSPMIDMVDKTPIERSSKTSYNGIVKSLLSSSIASFYIHHMKVMDNNSVHKGDNEPSAYLKSSYIRKNKEILIEMLKCVILSDEVHKRIHKLPYSDGMLYLDNHLTPYALPWGISSKENFNSLKVRFPVLEDVTFEEVFNDIFFTREETIYICEKLNMSL